MEGVDSAAGTQGARDGDAVWGDTAARGCTAAVVFAAGACLVMLGFLATMDMESGPGLRDNTAPLVVYLCALAALLAAGGVAVAVRRSRAARGAALCLAALLAWRMCTVAPALHCWSHNSVGRADDGSYLCYDR
ncbi:hypothetical protein [Actinacidiphila glaucinigra]|uniref:hypothetical protein n=1 Tax=Actinacidiphila glaucinigra TaxID=235986 RepID=UPI0029A17069|nr:hypothetical protein [Streptomyces sp. PA03-3a]